MGFLKIYANYESVYESGSNAFELFIFGFHSAPQYLTWNSPSETLRRKKNNVLFCKKKGFLDEKE